MTGAVAQCIMGIVLDCLDTSSDRSKTFIGHFQLFVREQTRVENTETLNILVKWVLKFRKGHHNVTFKGYTAFKVHPEEPNILNVVYILLSTS